MSIPTAVAVISPPGGHGSDAVSELGAMYAMVSAKFQYDESGKLTTNNDFRKFGLLLNPKGYQSNSLFTSLFATMTTNLTLTSVSGSYNGDDVVVGQTSGATGVIVDFASGTGLLRLVQVTGIFVVGEIVTEQITNAVGQISVIVPPTVQSNSGSILYTEHIQAIERASDQLEAFKITIPF